MRIFTTRVGLVGVLGALMITGVATGAASAASQMPTVHADLLAGARSVAAAVSVPDAHTLINKKHRVIIKKHHW